MTSPAIMNLQPIGVIRSPHRQAAGTPVQVAFADGYDGTVEVDPRFATGLKDLEGFERIWLIYWFDRALPAALEVTPYLDTRSHGVFATRAPSRPNPIGFSPVRLRRRDGNTLHVSDLDVLDGTPLLDLKPYVPGFDAFEAGRVGWYHTAARPGSTRADDRFSV
jgi:tRNA (adenine37-N6)-methyltransferase